MRHVSIQNHFVRDYIRRGILEIKWVRTTDMIADMMTKALGKTKFKEFRKALGIVNQGEDKTSGLASKGVLKHRTGAEKTQNQMEQAGSKMKEEEAKEGSGHYQKGIGLEDLEDNSRRNS